MATDTQKSLRNKVMYQVFTRNFSEEGTFEKVREKLDDIKELGVDIIWLMPIHPLGLKNRKGSLGSPYAISDYRSINPEYGTMDDFRKLVDDIHKKDMLCIIDVVYNHTSPDSLLSKEHPEWFYHKEDGSFGNRVGDWSDVIDLDYSNRDLWDYQIDTLKMWAETVDGFRCDVAPLIPIEFWMKARKEVKKVKQNCIWLSESIEAGFIHYMRSQGYSASTDSEIYKAFDISYDYDIKEEFMKAVIDGDLDIYADAINRQEGIYPENYVKLRFLENHDCPRASFLIPDQKKLKNWTAFLYFQKGLTLVYAGQEYSVSHTPTLFDKDTVSFTCENSDDDLRSFMKTLYSIKKDDIFTDGMYSVKNENGCLKGMYKKGEKTAYGVFCNDTSPKCIHVDLKDGVYTNLLIGSKVEVFYGLMKTDGNPVIIID